MNVCKSTFQYHNRTRGFTLIELMILLALLAIVAVIVIPPYLRSRTKTQDQGGVRTIGDSYSGAEVDTALVNTEVPVSSPEVKVEAEHYLSEYGFSTIGVTLTPIHTNEATLQEVSIHLPDTLPLPFAEIINLNLNGSQEWKCSTQSDSTPRQVTCTGTQPMVEKKKSVFTLFFQEQFSTIPSDLDISLPYSKGMMVTTVPLEQH